MTETRTYTIEVEVEVAMTNKGYPETRPSLNDPGEPGAGPEFETESVSVGGKVIKGQGLHALECAVYAAIEDAAIDQAAEDNWDD